MALNLDSLLDSVKNAISNHVQAGGHQNFNTGGLLDKISDLFGSHAAGQSAGQSNVKPASQDPYGDPADQGGGRR